MLKALELFGFKSFADKTRFEFPPGITVIVGPNGSGKSNVVDAIKWVLGEQSAKSLRGKEMSDVIFKGGGDGARKVMNAAEASIVFDNSDRRLPFDAPEVHVTRRVYRSGEGEYLVNRQPCRLKDIRDMFRGTGVGTDAYSLIEQGKVDQLLQASSKDRRAIFEEAAGISRFKAKKVEAQRRLEHFDQNLLRLRDIVDEVESRLKNVRSQASKARRYREYSQRLQELRTQVGLTDWRVLSRRLAEVETQLATLRDEYQRNDARSQATEARVLEFDVALLSANESMRASENQLARTREQIGSREAASEFSRQRLQELEDEASQHRATVLALSGRGGRIQENLNGILESLRTAERSFQEMEARVTALDQKLGGFSQRLGQSRAAWDAARTEHLNVTRSLAATESQIENARRQLEALSIEFQQDAERIESITATLAQIATEFTECQANERRLEERFHVFSAKAETIEQELEEQRRLLRERQDLLTQMQEQLSGLRGRATVLEELEARFEGLAAGVRDILAMRRQGAAGELAGIRGVVADLLQAGLEMAPLVDAALGELSQCLVTSDQRLLGDLSRGAFHPPGRIGLVSDQPWIAPAAGWTAASADEGAASQRSPPWDGDSSVLGRAPCFVETAPELQPLVERLLGNTWFVDTLADALRLHDRGQTGCRFVTRSCEVVESNGVVVAGPASASSGLVSRHSELRELKRELVQLAKQADGVLEEFSATQLAVHDREALARQLADETRKLATTLTEQRMRTHSLHERFEQLDRERHQAESHLDERQKRRSRLQQELDEWLQSARSSREQLAQSEARIAELEQQHHQMESERQNEFRQVTGAKVELATSEQQVRNLRLQRVRFEDDQRERTKMLQEARDSILACVRRRRQHELELLTASAELATAYSSKDVVLQAIRDHVTRREELQHEKLRVSEEAHALRRELQNIAERIHQLELSAGELRLQRKTLADRLHEDYGIDLGNQTGGETHPDAAVRDEVEQEIETLRRKLNSIGAVNLEALNELDELETRYNSLSGQYNDLAQAKETLERIIQKINADSRRLFVETLNAIRTNFQNLYRRAFGGGKADILLEEGVDVLDAGVEIVATPPGKPSFNNSLLSGGEKALTAVALLLAIFEYRPSPFCVLDEVDAPFDEANIGRFVDVLKGFLDRTRFVIVTHSKKTMSAATTLYGVTMQESGVSKRVSVRFDDVSDDGRISEDAIQREKSADDERGAA